MNSPKLTAVVDGKRRIKGSPLLIYHFHENVQDFEKHRRRFFREYKKSLQTERRQIFERYQFQDVAVKAVGVGSIGMRCFAALFLANDNDPLFMQIKEACRSVWESPKGESRFAHQGLRVVHGQRLTRAASAIFLGWFRTHRRAYYVRQLREMKVSVEIDTFKQRTLTSYAALCGWALARAHAKSGDAATIAGYLGLSGRFDMPAKRFIVACLSVSDWISGLCP